MKWSSDFLTLSYGDAVIVELTAPMSPVERDALVFLLASTLVVGYKSAIDDMHEFTHRPSGVVH